MRAAIYLRVSTAAQAGQGHVSLDVQERRCREFVAQKGGEVVAVEQDHESGLKVTRAGYQRILDLARARRIDAVIVYAASRFGRRASEVLARVEELRDAHGVELYSTQEDLSSFLMVGITAVINEEQSRTIARLAGPARRFRAQQGYWLAHAPFGTRNNAGVLEPNTEFDIVRGVFERAAAGDSVRSITLWVNSLRDAPLTREGVREIIKNPAYVGKTRWAGETFPAKWEPIVPKALWREAQRAVRGRRNVRAGIDQERPHWIVGLAHCAACGHKMSRRIAVKQWGTRYEYLFCTRKDARTITIGCGARQHRLRPLQDLVLDEVRASRMSPPALDDYCRHLEEQQSARRATAAADRRALEAERSRLQDRLARARQGYMERVYDAAEYHRMAAGLRDGIAALDERIDDAEGDGPLDLAPVRALFGGDTWLRLAAEAPLQFRELLRVFVERIDVGEEVRVVWREPAFVSV